MIIVLSPAKTLDYSSSKNIDDYSSPVFLNKSKNLIGELKKKNPNEISKLMKLSDKLTSLNVERYQTWKARKKPSDNSKQSIYVFKGDVYQGLDIESFSKKDTNFAQKHLRILSGLYGILKPLDIIEPYRLEMGTKLKTKEGSDLYDFWGKDISEEIEKELKKMKSKTLINLASNEYYDSVKSLSNDVNVIAPIFKDKGKDGKYKIISFYAKKARGYMASWLVKNKINKEKDIASFSEEGYKFSIEDSQNNSPVFLRG
jgi:cytoplasmic iron level regulating protein YaaA (DUF328/UPF0246 family)|tara:strand:+ start:115 stop:888 length:774 start_codon:yes stop_codon:yes gene_type:complete